MNRLFKYVMLFAVALSAGFASSCSDDKEVDPYTINYVYMYQPQSTFTSIQYKATGDFLTNVATEVALMPIRCTKPAPADMTIEVAVDGSLVDEYNATHGTNYAFLKSASVVKKSFTIAKGEYVSKRTADDGVVVEDSVKVAFTDLSEFQNGSTDYIVPVTVSSVNAGGTIAKSGRIYLLFNSEYIANTVSAVSGKVAVDGEKENWQDDFVDFVLTDFMTASWNADEDITASVAISSAYADIYNSLNGTDYRFLEGASLKASQVTIKQGNLMAEGLGIELPDLSAVIEEELTYILPIVIDNVSGKGAELNADNKVAYIFFTPAAPEISFTSTAPEGATQLTPESDWSLTIWGESTKLLQGQSYYWVYSGDDMIIDLASVREVAAVGIYSYGGSSMYQYKDVTVSISNDGVNYTELGDLTFDYVPRAFINFSPVAKTRFVKVIMNSSYYPYGSYYLSALRGVYVYAY